MLTAPSCSRLTRKNHLTTCPFTLQSCCMALSFQHMRKQKLTEKTHKRKMLKNIYYKHNTTTTITTTTPFREPSTVSWWEGLGSRQVFFFWRVACPQVRIRIWFQMRHFSGPFGKPGTTVACGPRHPKVRPSVRSRVLHRVTRRSTSGAMSTRCRSSRWPSPKWTR